MATTPRHSMNVIHNDENAISSLQNKSISKSISTKKSSGGGLSARRSNTNSNSNNGALKASFANTTTKTPFKKSATNSRRRALGDISNRKGNNGNGGLNNSNGNVGLGRKSNAGKGKDTSVNINVNQSVRKTIKKKVPSSAIKKKSVSFVIHTTSDLTSDAEVVRKEIKDKVKTIQSNKQESSLKQRSKAGLSRRDLEEVEDIELSAGRTGEQERKLLDEADHLDLSIDVEEGLEAIRQLREQERVGVLNHLKHPFPVNERGDDAILEALAQLEHVDDDILQSHLMFEEYNEVLGGPFGNLEVDNLDDHLEDDLIAHLDDISL